MVENLTLTEPQVRKVKIGSILVSQPKPESPKSPYFDIAKRHNVKIDFRQFIQVAGIEGKDFRKAKINLYDYSAVIFTSRNAVDHFFRICEELRVKLSQETKYFCKSEAIALYLQKYTLYRKRKVAFSDGTDADLLNLLKKYRDNERFLFPCSEVHAKNIPDFMKKNKFDYTEAVIYRTVESDLTDLENITYDMIVFFSPSGVQSLFKNFPDFKQNNTKIAAFGTVTGAAIKKAGLRLDMQAPMPKVPSITMAIDRFLQENNN